MNRTREALVDTFRRLNAPDPESWAASELSEGIPQLLRFLVLRGIWKAIIREDDPRWIDAAIASSERGPDVPLAGVGTALSRMLAAGVSREDIVDVVRGKQHETAFALAYLLGDPVAAIDDLSPDLRAELEPVDWRLVGDYGDGRNIPVSSPHEDMLGTDPTGREMRPRRG